MAIERIWQHRIDHILEAVRKIARYTSGMTKEQFENNELVLDGVVRNFQVIGEATGKMPADVLIRYPSVPWKLMKGMRNVLVHRYDDINLNQVWTTVQTDLPALVPPLEAILAENPIPDAEA